MAHEQDEDGLSVKLTGGAKIIGGHGQGASKDMYLGLASNTNAGPSSTPPSSSRKRSSKNTGFRFRADGQGTTVENFRMFGAEGNIYGEPEASSASARPSVQAKFSYHDHQGSTYQAAHALLAPGRTSHQTDLNMRANGVGHSTSALHHRSSAAGSHAHSVVNLASIPEDLGASALAPLQSYPQAPPPPYKKLADDVKDDVARGNTLRHLLGDIAEKPAPAKQPVSNAGGPEESYLKKLLVWFRDAAPTLLLLVLVLVGVVMYWLGQRRG